MVVRNSTKRDRRFKRPLPGGGSHASVEFPTTRGMREGRARPARCSTGARAPSSSLRRLACIFGPATVHAAHSTRALVGDAAPALAMSQLAFAAVALTASGRVQLLPGELELKLLDKVDVEFPDGTGGLPGDMAAKFLARA